MITLIPGGTSWEKTFSDAVVVTDADKVFKNTRNDYGLGPRFTFAGGRHINGVWTSCYLEMARAFENLVRPYMSEGRIGSVQPIRSNGVWMLSVTAENNIGRVLVRLADEPPEKLIQFFKVVTP